jgi:putative transposase
MVTSAAKRETVAHLMGSYEMSERRACCLINADRKTVRYRSRRPRDEDLRRRLKELAAEQRRFGYRRLHVLLRAEGHLVNRKKTQRLSREEGLTVRKREGPEARCRITSANSGRGAAERALVGRLRP